MPEEPDGLDRSPCRRWLGLPTDRRGGTAGKLHTGAAGARADPRPPRASGGHAESADVLLPRSQGTEGLEFELARSFAAKLGVTLSMFPVANVRAMQDALASGRADIAARS